MSSGSGIAHVPHVTDVRAAWRDRRRRGAVVFVALLFVVLAATIAGVCVGAYRIAPATLWAVISSGRPVDSAAGNAVVTQAHAVLWSIRLPRVVLALLVGAGFGAAGSALQALFRNPLADPGLVGISSGAALGAAVCIVLGPLIGLGGLAGDWALAVAAFVGALAVSSLVYRIAAARGRLALPLLLLAGIAINALAGAAIGLLTYMASDLQLRTLTFWTLGSLSGAGWPALLAVTPFVAVGVLLMARHGGALNALQLGEAEAAHLGVPTHAVKRTVLVAASLSIGALVSCTGLIGFIGLVAPHCVRLVCGPDQRVVLPNAMLLGAALTVLADLAARTVAAPAEVPLGILMAMIGAPFFLALLWRNRDRFGL